MAKILLKPGITWAKKRYRYLGKFFMYTTKFDEVWLSLVHIVTVVRLVPPCLWLKAKVFLPFYLVSLFYGNLVRVPVRYLTEGQYEVDEFRRVVRASGCQVSTVIKGKKFKKSPFKSNVGIYNFFSSLFSPEWYVTPCCHIILKLKVLLTCRDIGVSNFTVGHLTGLLAHAEVTVTPAVNQVPRYHGVSTCIPVGFNPT
jgi:hypothetical protein